MRKASSAKSAFTMDWQSSKEPSTATQRTLSASAVVMKRRCTSLILPSGNSTTSRTAAEPAKASTAAPPVSPEVATTRVSRRPVPSSATS